MSNREDNPYSRKSYKNEDYGRPITKVEALS